MAKEEIKQFKINKGVGKPVEFYGLQAQYIGYLFGGLLGSFMVFVIIYMAGVPTVLSIIIFVAMLGFTAYYVFTQGKKYGEHGLDQYRAKQAQPKHIVATNPNLFRNLKKGNPRR